MPQSATVQRDFHSYASAVKPMLITYQDTEQTFRPALLERCTYILVDQSAKTPAISAASVGTNDEIKPLKGAEQITTFILLEVVLN